MASRAWAAQDRIRTRAVSLYLADHRENLCQKLPVCARTAGANVKRNRLLHLARRCFRVEGFDVQRRYLQKAAGIPSLDRSSVPRRLRGKQRVDAQSGPSGRGEVLETPKKPVSKPEQTSGRGDVQRTSGGGDVQRTSEKPVSRPGEVDQMSDEQTSGRWGVEQPSAPSRAAPMKARAQPWGHHFEARTSDTQDEVRSCITQHIGSLRTMYGDIAAAEVFGASLRFLDQFGCALKRAEGASPPALPSHREALTRVKSAAIIGLAVKMVLTAELVDRAPVSQLWSKIVVGSNVARVRALETQLVSLWPGLERDYVQL